MVTVFRRLVIWVAVLLAAGCVTRTEPFEYIPEREVKQGPGLFSGKEGKVTFCPWGEDYPP